MFSIRTCCPSDCVSFAASGRANVSVPPPPAGNGLIIRIGFCGQACAGTSAAPSASATVQNASTSPGTDAS